MIAENLLNLCKHLNIALNSQTPVESPARVPNPYEPHESSIKIETEEMDEVQTDRK